MKVFIIEKDDVLRFGLKSIIDDMKKHELIGNTKSANKALRLISKQPPDIVIMGTDLSEMDVLQFIKKSSPKSSVNSYKSPIGG